MDQSSPNFVGMLRNCHRTQLSYQNCTFTKIQDGGRHHLEFRKCVTIQCGGGRHFEIWKVVAISLLSNHCAPKLMRMLWIWYGTHCIVKKCKFTKIEDGGCRHLELRKSFTISILFDLFSPNLVGMLQTRCWMQPLSRKWARGFNSKMVAAAILNFETMWPFHYM